MRHSSAATLGRFETVLGPSALRRATALRTTARLKELQEILRSAQVDERLRADGLVVLSGLNALSLENWPRLFVAICGVLGLLLPQSMTDAGQVVREIRYRGGGLNERTIRYSDSRSGGSYHNDGVPMPGPLPDLLALLCVRPAARGGEVVFVDSSAALDAASRRMPRLPIVLGREFHFDQRRTDDPAATVVRRIVERTGGKDQLVYLRDYVESGHSMAGVRPLVSEEIQAMDILDEVLEDEALHTEGRLSPGQIVISDNRRYVHGRHEFREEAGEQGGRLMLRCWVRTSRCE
jgi:alpha-ketoglutarate-dependent taurine dioxygenase